MLDIIQEALATVQTAGDDDNAHSVVVDLTAVDALNTDTEDEGDNNNNKDPSSGHPAYAHLRIGASILYKNSRTLTPPS